MSASPPREGAQAPEIEQSGEPGRSICPGTYNILDREAGERIFAAWAQEKGIAVIVNRPFDRAI